MVGRLDSPLTTLGYHQAESAAVLLAGRRPALSAVVTSDLQRAHVTAQIIAGVLNLPLHVEPGLREQHFGWMEGVLSTDLSAAATGHQHINDVRWGDGESVTDVYARLVQAFARIESRHTEPIVVVTHGHVIQIAMSLLRGRGPRDVEWFDLPNGGIVGAPEQAP